MPRRARAARSVAGMATHDDTRPSTRASDCSPGSPSTERRLELRRHLDRRARGRRRPAVVLLHGPGGNATHWLRVIPDLVATHRVIAPDLPGHGASEAPGALDAERVLAWLDELIGATCAVAARARRPRARRRDRGPLRRPAGRAARRGSCSSTRSACAAFAPAPAFGHALHAFLAAAGRGHPRRPLAAVRARPGRAARAHGRALGAVRGLQRRPRRARRACRPRSATSWSSSGCRRSRRRSSSGSPSPRR